ncbi:MAG: gliding motility-associated C-terminal domain-containing protein [Bacteroidales bacterium]|nr:gliding motility-associated C-terminal domain-containing protein [Bacteroidales bacterium]
MKKIFLLMLLSCLWIATAFGQGQVVVLMSENGFTEHCNVLFMDPGGEIGNYGNNLEYVHTFHSPNNSQLMVKFIDFSLSDDDKLYVYDGDNTSSIATAIFDRDHSPVGDFTLSDGTSLTFRFITNSSGTSAGWKATITCFVCNQQSTEYGSPCNAEPVPIGTQMTAFCTNSNEFGATSFPSNTANPPGTVAVGCEAFIGSGSPGCFGVVSNPSWHVFKTIGSGLMVFNIQQVGYNGSCDVDYVLWGPFKAKSLPQFRQLLCCGYYDIYAGDNWTTRPPSNIIVCDYSVSSTQPCFFVAEEDSWYLLLITNSEGSNCQGANITFGINPSTVATTDCSITSGFTANEPCLGDSLILTVSNPIAGASYNFTGPNSFNVTTESPVYVKYNITTADIGTYNLTVINNGTIGQTTHYPVKLGLNPLLVHPFLHNDSICAGVHLQVSTVDMNPGGHNTTFVWSIGGRNYYSSSVNTLLSTTSMVYVTATSSAGCISTDSALIHIYDPPYVNIFPREGCSGSVFIAHTDEPTNTFLWSDGSRFQFNTVFCQKTSRISLEVESLLGCVSTDTITVYPAAEADFTASDYFKALDLNNEASIFFTNNSLNSEYIYHWDFGDRYHRDFENLNTSIEKDPSHIYTYPGHYPVELTVTTHQLCSDTSLQYILITDPVAYMLPNAFTPDGDGINDVYLGKGYAFDRATFSMRIYNRHGKLLFETVDPDAGWDGTDHGGKKCPSGVYTCIVKLTTNFLEPKEYIQPVTLYRQE